MEKKKVVSESQLIDNIISVITDLKKMVLDLKGKRKENNVPQEKSNIEMIEIPASGKNIQIKDDDLIRTEGFTDNFYMSETPITQEQYEEVMGENPSHFRGKKLPVERVTWWDAIKFCNELSLKENREVCYDENTGDCDFKKNGYRLPTEAEWEYAYRGGTIGERYGDLEKIAWYNENSSKNTHIVGQKEPNGYGLYDMLGNVWEWCQDWYIKSSLKGVSEPESSERVMRGGSWIISAEDCRCAYRDWDDPGFRNSFVGFRLVSSSRS